MSIIPTIIVAGVSLLFVAIAIAPMVIEMAPKPRQRPELKVLPGGFGDMSGDQQTHAA